MTPGSWYNTCKRKCYSTADSGDDSTTECVSQEELADVKTEIERKVDQLHSQLHYWQNMTVTAVKDHCSSINTGFYSQSHSIEPVSITSIFRRSDKPRGNCPGVCYFQHHSEQ